MKWSNIVLMKFAVSWKLRYNSLPFEFQKGCLDYKKFKKLSKHVEPVEIQKELLRDALYTDQFFKRVIKTSNKASFACSFVGHLICEYTSQHVLEFLALNKLCAYKICKRLDKRLTTEGRFLSWYEQMCLQTDYAFLSRLYNVYLTNEFAQHKQPLDCPICLEANDDQYIVTSCGHAMCTRCALKFLNVDNLNGTLHNKIAYGVYNEQKVITCPLCRNRQPFKKYKLLTSSKPLD